jgi:hypothetical protein
MTYGCVRLRAHALAFGGAAVDHPAELMRGD